MYIEISYLYKLKKDTEPTSGQICHSEKGSGSNQLELQAVDSKDGSVLMQPEYYQDKGFFWCDPKDLEEDG